MYINMYHCLNNLCNGTFLKKYLCSLLGFLAWAITCTLTIILIILKKYLLKTFHLCNRCKAQSQPDTQPSVEIPLPNISTPSPTLATLLSSSSDDFHPCNQCTTQSQPDTQPSVEIPLPNISTPSPTLASPSSSSSKKHKIADKGQSVI